MSKSQSHFKKGARTRQKKYYVVVVGKKRWICKRYSKVREAMQLGAYLKVFNKKKSALRYVGKGKIDGDSYREFVWNTLPISSAEWRSIYLDK